MLGYLSCFGVGGSYTMEVTINSKKESYDQVGEFSAGKKIGKTFAEHE